MRCRVVGEFDRRIRCYITRIRDDYNDIEWFCIDSKTCVELQDEVRRIEKSWSRYDIKCYPFTPAKRADLANKTTLSQTNARIQKTQDPATLSCLPQMQSKSSNVHQTISNGNNDRIRNETARNAARQKVADLQISLAGLRVFHHDRSCRKGGQPEESRTAREKFKHLLIFGKPEVGKPIAAEAIRTEPMTRRFGCGLSIPSPTCATSGRMIRAATV